MSPLKLSSIGELSLLKEIRNTFRKKSPSVLVGIGDDAAVLRAKKGYLLATTDMMVEGVHFDLSFVTPYQLGFKLISVNVSDIYAMAGKPSYALLDFATRGDVEKDFVDKFFTGVKDALTLYRAELIGGDVSSSTGCSCVSATLIGYTNRFIGRSGAKVGDRIYVTGHLGDSACGLAVLKKLKKPIPIEAIGKGGRNRMASMDATVLRSLSRLGLSGSTIEPLLRRHLMPEARDSSSISRSATSLIDISDGLLIDLWRLCDESGVGARIYEEKIPLSDELKAAADRLGIEPLRIALTGGEDYEILFTAPPAKKVKAIYVGDVIKSGRFIVNKAGREKSFSAEGYSHFSRERVIK